MLHSYYQSIGKIALPFQQRQVYMAEIDLETPMLANAIRDYEDIVINLCNSVGAYHGKAYVTVDEQHLKMGDTQRKPGPHVDGRYLKSIQHWGHEDPGGHWNHSCNVIPNRMAVIVASTVPLCRAWEGDFNGLPRITGDCQHVLDDAGVLDDFKRLNANEAYLLSPDCIHESMSAIRDCARTFLRIALPTDFHYTGVGT